MNILVCGAGKAGSWVIRGEQLGTAIGARVDALGLKLGTPDLAILVKRARNDVVQRLHATGVPIIWDALDAWRQGCSDDSGRETCMRWLRDRFEVLRPSSIVAATQAMAEDCAEFGVPVLALPHHARAQQALNPILETVRTVAYEGRVEYLGWWQQFMIGECERRGWRFVLNPAQLADVDIVVAVRAERGYGPTHWKSGVKLANAQGSGTPCILNMEAGYQETASGGEVWANTKEQMVAGLEFLADPAERRSMAGLLLAHAPTLDAMATKYKAWLHQLKF